LKRLGCAAWGCGPIPVRFFGSQTLSNEISVAYTSKMRTQSCPLLAMLDWILVAPRGHSARTASVGTSVVGPASSTHAVPCEPKASPEDGCKCSWATTRHVGRWLRAPGDVRRRRCSRPRCIRETGGRNGPDLDQQKGRGCHPPAMILARAPLALPKTSLASS